MCVYMRACLCVYTCFSCQRSGNHCALLLSCFFSRFALKHKGEQIVHHKHTLVLTGSVLRTKTNLISLSLHNYMRTHTLSSNQNVFGKTPSNTKIETYIRVAAMLDTHFVWPSERHHITSMFKGHLLWRGQETNPPCSA